MESADIYFSLLEIYLPVRIPWSTVLFFTYAPELKPSAEVTG